MAGVREEEDTLAEEERERAEEETVVGATEGEDGERPPSFLPSTFCLL